MYDPAEEEARAAKTAKQQAEDFENAMKKITLHHIPEMQPKIRKEKRHIRCRRAVIHSDFNLKGKRK